MIIMKQITHPEVTDIIIINSFVAFVAVKENMIQCNTGQLILINLRFISVVGLTDTSLDTIGVDWILLSRGNELLGKISGNIRYNYTVG